MAARKVANLCPGRFDIEQGEENSALITPDGNMQHMRFKDRDRSPWEFDELIPKLFVYYGRRQFDLPANISLRDEIVIPNAACGHRCKATNGWNRAEIKTATKKNLDESGLIAVTCFHGINLRFLNIYGDGERHSHATGILEAILEYAPEVEFLNLCYDVACVFESTVHRYKLQLGERL